MTAGATLDLTTTLLRELTPQVLGRVARRAGDFAAAEDAVQEALLAASQQWPSGGVPENPRAWLTQVASRRLTDEIRAAAARRQREAIVVSLIPAEEQLARAADEPDSEVDDSLELLFLSCHPSLSPASAIALTLRAVGGLTTAEIARAFLVPEATMAQRISRAKQTIKASGVPFGRPDEGAQVGRLGAVMHVLYLIFSEGYAASSGREVQRSDLANEAIRLARLLRRVAPAEGEVAGLLALMLLTNARREARTGPGGELVPLDAQDRARWDQAAIAEGVALLGATLGRGPVGPYQVQAAIAAVHDEAGRASDTDWAQILALYEVLVVLDPSPMAALSHAVAVAMVHGAAAGLARLDALAPRLAGHHRLDAVRAHLLERAGEVDAAAQAFVQAAGRATSLAERDYLVGRAARAREPPPSPPCVAGRGVGR